MRNILVPEEVQEVCLRTTGKPFPKDRCTGRTTLQAMQTIVTAMSNPCVPYTIPYDHYTRTEYGRSQMLYVMQDIVRKLDFVGFTFNKTHLTVTYSIWEE